MITDTGVVIAVPDCWELLPPGDAGVTRRVKAMGPCWTVKEKKGRRTFSRGVWAPSDWIAKVKADFAEERSSEAYKKRRATAAKRRDQKQTEYVEDFRKAILDFLSFATRYESVANQLATAVAAHATPIGSGTVARTQRIPIERRAESAVIAWMRHQTTAYDNMKIARIKGHRREVRRMLADQSRQLLHSYRSGTTVDLASCPLWLALEKESR